MLDALKELVKAAGAAILTVYETGDFQVDMKSDDSPLTKADRESNLIICNGLQQLDASIHIVSEENKAIPYAQRRHFQKLWLVDPLDGTKEFIKRNGEFTINIALIEEGKPVFGIVYVPVTRELFYAIKGVGAHWEKDGDSGELHVAEFSMQDHGLYVVCSRSHLNTETQAFIDSLNGPEAVSRGSALKFILVAAGEAHLYPRLAPTMEWDTAAAQCIVEEAGGFVVEYESKKPMQYNKESLLNPSFLSGGRVISDFGLGIPDDIALPKSEI